MATINDLRPSSALKERLKAAFPTVDVDTAELRTYTQHSNLTPAQKAVVSELHQLAVETANE